MRKTNFINLGLILSFIYSAVMLGIRLVYQKEFTVIECLLPVIVFLTFILALAIFILILLVITFLKSTNNDLTQDLETLQNIYRQMDEKENE